MSGVGRFSMGAVTRPKKWWTTKEVAYELGVAERTIYRLARRKILPAIKAGWQWRFNIEQIKAWIAEGGCDKWL